MSLAKYKFEKMHIYLKKKKNQALLFSLFACSFKDIAAELNIAGRFHNVFNSNLSDCLGTKKKMI